MAGNIRTIAEALDGLATAVQLDLRARRAPNAGQHESDNVGERQVVGRSRVSRCGSVERLKGIEPSSSVWKTEALPLSYSRRSWWPQAWPPPQRRYRLPVPPWFIGTTGTAFGRPPTAGLKVRAGAADPSGAGLCGLRRPERLVDGEADR